MFFTQEDYKKIEEYLKQNSKKDTDFKCLDVTQITPGDSIAVVHNLQNRQINIFDLLSSDITGFFAKERWLLGTKIKELENLIQTFSIEKVGVTDSFGNSQIATVSQRALTDAFDKVWEKLHEITGEPNDGICVKITPEVFISEGAGVVKVIATATNKVFEKVKIYVNDNLVIEKNYTHGFIENITIEDTSVITTTIQIMGKEYTDVKVINKLFPFFIGSGVIWQDAETVENAQPFRGHLSGSYDVTVHNDNDKIYVIIPKRLAYQMIRVDMNGFEVPMSTHEDGEKLIYESTNTYIAGRYNIDIICNCNCHTQTPEVENTEENNG